MGRENIKLFFSYIIFHEGYPVSEEFLDVFVRSQDLWPIFKEYLTEIPIQKILKTILN
jgi:hypothetical protein